MRIELSETLKDSECFRLNLHNNFSYQTLKLFFLMLKCIARKPMIVENQTVVKRTNITIEIVVTELRLKTFVLRRMQHVVNKLKKITKFALNS